MFSPLLSDLENHRSPLHVQLCHKLSEKGMENIYVISGLMNNCCTTFARYYSFNEYLKCLVSCFR